MVLVCASVWSIALHQPDGHLHIQVLRAGEESTLVLQTPRGKTLVFDPGKQVNELSAALSCDLSPWNYSIDEVWLTNRDAGKNLQSLNERTAIRKIILTPPAYITGAEDAPLVLPQGMEIIKLKTAQTYEVEPGVTLTMVAEDGTSAALCLEYSSLRLLIPGGVDYALIREQAPAALESPTVLVLTPEDISYIPARVWTALDPRVILWNSTALAPAEDWPGLDVYSRVEVISEGESFQVNASQ